MVAIGTLVSKQAPLKKNFYIALRPHVFQTIARAPAKGDQNGESLYR